MSGGGSHLRVELRSPKRSLDGGYGFDLTKYCASCWSRFGRILRRGARCGTCGRRVCKGCRHFVAAKEWICALCYKKKYSPEDSWHDDANIKRFKRSQGKSGTYLLRLTDWSAHGVLEMHEISEFQTGRIRSFSNESFSLGFHASKGKLHHRNFKSKFKYPTHSVKPTFNYPLVQHDIQQLKDWKAEALNHHSQCFRDKSMKYTSVNLKQKRRELRECRTMSVGRGRPYPDGIPNECLKRKSHHLNRINSAKREQFGSAKASSSSSSSHDYGDNPLTPSVRRAKQQHNSNFHPCTNSSPWQKEHRRSRSGGRNCNGNFSAAVLHRGEPHVRLSVRGTRIFGRRKSYRACPTLKGDSSFRCNGTATASPAAAAVLSKCSSLPCELSQIESQDFEFWNSGFVQSRVRRLEEELTANCEDRYSCHDYEVQSLCSLRLDKILPDGDDYRIAYLSSTSQESSLDYMDEDNYCTIPGMGTLDVKLNKKYALTRSQDWDLTFSSTEENNNNETSSDDDEFFYRKYSGANNNDSSTILAPSCCYSRHLCPSTVREQPTYIPQPSSHDTILHVSRYDTSYSDVPYLGALDDSKEQSPWVQRYHDGILHVSSHDKEYSDVECVGTLDDSKSLAQQIHESVDRIFYNVMNYDLDIPHSAKEKHNNAITLEYFSCSSNEEIPPNCFQDKEDEMRFDRPEDFTYSLNEFKSFQYDNQDTSAVQHSYPEHNLFKNSTSYVENHSSQNTFATDFLYDDKNTELNGDSVPIQFADNASETLNGGHTFESESLNESLFYNHNQNCSPECENTISNSQIEDFYGKKIDYHSQCLNSENESIEFLPVHENETSKISLKTTPLSQYLKGELSYSDISINEKNLNFLPEHENKIKTTSISQYVKGELSYSDICINENSLIYTEPLLLPNDDFEIKNDNFSEFNVLEVESGFSKCHISECKNADYRRNFQNSGKRSKYKMKRDRWTENEKAKFVPQTESILEAELIIYEPLSTPFSEIYFITYGRKYPSKSCYKLSIPRKILRDVENEIILSLANQNNLLPKQLHSSNNAIYLASRINSAVTYRRCENDVCNSTGKPSNIPSLINSYITQNYSELSVPKSIERCRNYEFNMSSDMRTIQRSSKPIFNNHLLISLKNKKIYLQCTSLKYTDIIKFALSELSETANSATTVTDFRNNFSYFLHSESYDTSHISRNVSTAPCNLQFLKSFFKLCAEFKREISQKSVLRKTNVSICESVAEYFHQFFRILNAIKLLSDDNHLIVVDVSQLAILTSSFLYAMKNTIQSSRETNSAFCQKAKFLNKSCSFKLENTDKISKTLEIKNDSYNSENNFHVFKYSEFFSKEHARKTNFSSNSKAEYSSGKRNKISKKVYKIIKNRKLRNKKWDTIFRNTYLSKSQYDKNTKRNSISIYNETIEDILIALAQKVFISENCLVYQHMRRNRNYGIGYYYAQKETEITNEVREAGETSESRFAAESQPKATTSLTGNATFVEYLFPPQLASVRDTTQAHLSVSPIQHFQSVPAVQSRLVRSGRDLKHGSRYVTTASLTDIDCLCGSPDVCVSSESLEDGYPITLNPSETERITSPDHDFEDYPRCGSVPKGLQQLICNKVSFGDINCDLSNPVCVPSTELQQGMATCDGDPRLINKPTRTPGRNISKLKKLFDSRDGVVSDSDISYSKNDDNSSFSSHSVSVNKTTNPSQTLGNESDSNHISNGNIENHSLNGINGSCSKETNDCKSQQRIPSDIPYCRKVTNSGDLWKNVDTGIKSSNGVLWNSTENDSSLDNSHNIQTDLKQSSNSFVSSTADLHNLIAASRAELSKKKEPLLSDKSTLENYFTSFENSKPKKCVPLSSTDHFVDDPSDFLIPDNEIFKTSVTYGCDVDEMNFDEEEATLSDTSSDEEIRCNPPINTHYLPAYALHTIIEESCEESERDSRGPTPTNEPVTSKLERYFSWDIINDTETDVKRKEDDDSTVFSDSLSEGSESLNGDASKEIDPSQLASSRLEKYFTSGLVGNENYFYPDDAEFLEDAPVSDFEEDSIHQKISRSALLSSLETVAEQQTASSQELSEVNNELKSSVQDNSSENNQSVCDNGLVSDANSKELDISDEIKDVQNEQNEIEASANSEDNEKCPVENKCEIEIQEVEIEKQDTAILDTSSTSSDKSADVVLYDNVENSESIQPEVIESTVNVSERLSQKQTVSKEQLAIDVQAIIKKLLMYFSGTGSNSFKHNKESDYISAWQILETEIERLIQSISPTVSLENNSCNSSTIDSNNSDYGSDTIESIECVTDEDEVTDSKSRSNAKYPIVDLFNAAYKIQPGLEFHNFNISDETLSIWKRLIHSLQKDSFCMNDNKLYDPNTEARLYIRDQIVNLMHTVTVSESKADEIDPNVLNIQDKDIASSLTEESGTPEDINEAFNVSVNSCSLLTYCEEDILSTTVAKEPSDEGISVESSESIKPSSNVPESETKSTTDNDVAECNSESSNKLPGNPSKEMVLNTYLYPSVESKEEVLSSHLCPEKINVDEVDLKFSSRKSTDNPNFSMCVDIDLGDETSAVKNKNSSEIKISVPEDDTTKRSSLHLWVSGNDESSDEVNLTRFASKDDSLYVQDDILDLPPPLEIPGDAACASSDTKIPDKSYRDTGYYSFKSSDDSILHDTPPPDEFMDVPNFKSLKRSVKKFPLSNTLSKSTTNINQVFSAPDAKFSTLQLKSQKSKGSSNSTSSPSKQFTSLFSPTAVFKKLTGSKGNDTQTTDSSIPSKYLKKYARSSSVDSESMIGAISMPQLNFPKPSDSYSALGLYSENDRDSSLIADDDIESKRYPAYSHSVLSLGAHSVSMTSVYSAAACHYGYVTVSGDVLFGLNYNQKSQMMEVFVKQCRNLGAVDIRRNKSDPYVKVYLLPDKTKGGKRKTKTKKNTLNPVFNELLRFPVLKHELESRTLWLSVWNSDLFGRNDFLGEVTLPLGYRLLDSPTLRWYPLQERMESLTSPLNYRGELFLALKYVPRDLSLESRFRPAPVISLRGALHILVKEARNISANGSGSNLDAFCKSYLLPDKSKSSKQKTPVVKKSRHPKWYYTVIYEDLTIDELKERSLELTVWDHDKITSNEFMGGIRLNLGSGLYHGISVEWMDARRDEAALWESMIQSPNMWVDGCLPLRPTMQFHHG